ncbi:hypothetical protein GCM10027217_19260 [Pseudomaricurvus hydrocarbonicus]
MIFRSTIDPDHFRFYLQYGLMVVSGKNGDIELTGHREYLVYLKQHPTTAYIPTCPRQLIGLKGQR